ncbi:porin family protein [Methylocapsa polymorpha]|uniref:Porin family protein n=1 Tax=Methylocapsa polymorpha TaxID=3080828 RepID=A0ABZ0HTN3_9HYPH|nr:porin family protein [Methylocapsa sp. RX1]
MKHAFSRRLIGSLAGIWLTAGTAALAADLPSRVPEPLPPPPVFSWTGAYVTAQVGGAWDHTNFDVFPFSHFGLNDAGVFGGLNVGYNIQAGPLVIGIQGEYNFAGISGNRLAFPFNTVTDSLREFGSADARAGWAFDRVLVYAIGGFAYGDFRNSLQFVTPVAFGGARSYIANEYGWDVGGGVEYAFTDNVTARVEYRYYSWGTKTFNDALNGPINGFAFPSHTTNETLQTVRVGLSYKFGAPAAPIVAKY